MSRSVVLDVNAQMYENGGFIFGRWKDCRIILYSDSRMDWFFDQTKLSGSLILNDLKNGLTFDGVGSSSSSQNRPFVPKLIKANLLFSVAADKSGKYFHWFLFENKADYNEFCDAVCSVVGLVRSRKKPRSPSVDPSKRKPRSRSALPNRLRFLRGGGGASNADGESSDAGTPTAGSRRASATPMPVRRNQPHTANYNHHAASVDGFLDQL